VDLARLLGVSHATVSFVLNGLAEKHKISKKTTERVLAAAKKHNYIPNQMARNLKNRRSGMIGVVLGNFKLDWAEAAMTGMQKALDATDYVPFVTTHGFDEARNRKELLSALYRRDEGIITFPMPGCDDIYRRIAQSGVPLVFLGDELPGLEDISSVVWDSEAAAEAAVRHLIETGRRRIAFLGVDYPGLGTLHRFKAYCRVLREHGLALHNDWIARPPANLNPEDIARLALDQFFSKKQPVPDAIFALNDGLALPALGQLEARGFPVPGDVAIIGMGNLPLSAHPAIGLSTLREPLEEMGQAAAILLLEMITGKAATPVRRALSSCEVFARRTTACKQGQI
jgi:DNA-binding LacI/PurR family transcriptional regulator